MSKNIVIVIPTMKQGGAERVVSLLANYWSNKNYLISIVTFDKSEAYFSLNQNIAQYKLDTANNKFGGLSFFINNIKRFFKYLKCIKKVNPDVIISIADNANVFCVLYNFFLHKPLIITQRTNPLFNTLPSSLKFLPKAIYKKANAIVVQTMQTLVIYEQLKIKLPPIQKIIYNPLNENIYKKIENIQRKNIVLAVGRLYNYDKHFDALIDIFGSIENKDWELHIIGDGQDRESLLQQTNKLNLSHKVKLLGSIKNIASYYQQAKIFTLTSQFEGFPNALSEAMANGCACISYNCDTGPAEIIINEKNGLLIELNNTNLFKTQLENLMNNEEKIKQFSEEAIKLQELLNEEVIMDEWDTLITKITK